MDDKIIIEIAVNTSRRIKTALIYEPNKLKNKIKATISFLNLVWLLNKNQIPIPEKINSIEKNENEIFVETLRCSDIESTSGTCETKVGSIAFIYRNDGIPICSPSINVIGIATTRNRSI